VQSLMFLHVTMLKMYFSIELPCCRLLSDFLESNALQSLCVKMFSLVLGLLVSILSLASAQCYGQNGETTTDTPCETGSFPTFCCPAGTVCLSNGLCGKGNIYQIGTCSDPSFSGGSCVKSCRMSTPFPAELRSPI
jgi:hypothetical protein